VPTPCSLHLDRCAQMDHPGYTRTSLTIKQGKDKPRPLVHWWFTGWPDHGTPKKDGKLWADDVLTCMIEVNKVCTVRVGAAPGTRHWLAARTRALLACVCVCEP